MYTFNQEQIKTIQTHAIEYLGQVMKYKDLCTSLEIPYLKQTKLKDTHRIFKLQRVSV